jgi:signal transduction histidine kinase
MIKKKLPLLNHHKMLERTRELLNYLEAHFNPLLPVFKLTAAQQYMVEFIRVLMLDPRIIILDEVASKMTPGEMKKIYRALFNYRDLGVRIIYISHDMDEVLRLADRVTILKDGYRRGTELCRNLDKYRLFQLTYSYSVNQERTDFSQEKLLMLNRYVEGLLHHLPFGALILDENNRVQLLNFAAAELFNFNLDLAKNRTIEEILDGAVFPEKEEIIEAVNNRETREWEELEIEPDIILKARIFSLEDEKQQVQGMAVFFEDISIDKYMTDYLIRSEKMASVAEVAVGVAHEINNPLSIIKNYLKIISKRELEEDVGTKVAKIETELNRIVEIVSNLLSFSRIKPTPGKTIHLQGLLDEILLLLHHSIAEKKIRLEKKLPTKPVILRGEENRLKQVFMNLIMNSVDAVLDEGLIRIDMALDNGGVLVSIGDNGYGIPEDIRDKIFNPFFTTKITKKNTGLGLSVCQYIVEEHGGNLNFVSKPGEETVFSLKLPVS